MKMDDRTVFFIMTSVILFFVLLGAASAGIWLHMRRKYISFAEETCRSIDAVLNGKSKEAFDMDRDTLLSKVQMKLKRLEEITAAAARKSEAREQEVQEIISDLSHQLKTPVANIMMYCDTAMNPVITEEEREKCMLILKDQVGKLDFLVQAMIRMSRLEQNVISLHPDVVSLRCLMGRTLQSIRGKAAEKKISLKILCEEDTSLLCDEKWTVEALFNVLDNAIKYSSSGSVVTVNSERFEIYTKIEIKDEGIGISPEHAADVCKRFFREEKAAKTEGVGIGLYLTREILEKENGYLKISAGERKGTTVSIYLLNAGELMNTLK